MARVLLATCSAMPAGDDDEQLALRALADVGVDAVPAVWDDPGVDWSGADHVVRALGRAGPARRRVGG